MDPAEADHAAAGLAWLPVVWLVGAHAHLASGHDAADSAAPALCDLGRRVVVTGAN
ncbi:MULTISPECIES: hypothetical protein [Actinomycetes]|uniref:hypothetical protein n=1 Tax=Actinomycetes TaxID=1760 RepID=UPI001319D3EF|nr:MULTISPECIES: hypothetical protein [Actinomycetes]